MLQLALMCLAVGLCYSQKSIQILPCSDESGEVTEVRIIPCIDEPCQFQRGSTVLVEVDFVANSGVENPKIAVGAKLGPVVVPLPGLKTDACDGYNLECPLRKGNAYTFKHNLNVLPIYPKISTTTVYRLTGGEYGTIFCFQAPARII